MEDGKTESEEKSKDERTQKWRRRKKIKGKKDTCWPLICVQRNTKKYKHPRTNSTKRKQTSVSERLTLKITVVQPREALDEAGYLCWTGPRLNGASLDRWRATNVNVLVDISK